MGTVSRLTWTKAVPEPAELHVAECGMYVFEISATTDQGYLLQMWQTRPDDWPLVAWEMDGFLGLDEAKQRAERLTNQYVPGIVEG